MLPGKVYRPEDLLRLLLRRAWFLILPFAVVSAAATILANRLPDQFRSETLILVVPQRVPESYVKSTVTTKIEDRLLSISQQILSRTRLERTILDFDLYKKARATGLMEDVVESMRKDIAIQVVKGDAFRIGYIGEDARTVMRVTERLASLFIEENLRDREVLAEGTNQFLESQLDDARRRLIEQEQRLEEYRRRYSGQLPSQLESNLQVIQNTQLQIQTVVESLDRDSDRRLLLDRQIADLEAAPIEPDAPFVTVDGQISPGTTAAQQLATSRAVLAGLQQRLKPEHPDVLRTQRLVRELEQKVLAEVAQLASTPASPSPAPTLSAGAQARQKRLVDLRGELEHLTR